MRRNALLLALLLGALACEPPVDGTFVTLQVEGTVRALDGSPVAGATLDVRARVVGTCLGDVDQGPATSTAAGNFSRMLGNWGKPMDVCVWIAVQPPLASGLAPDTVMVTPARLDFGGRTLTVDITLPPHP